MKEYGNNAVNSQNVQYWSQTMEKMTEANPTDRHVCRGFTDYITRDERSGNANEIMGKIADQFSRSNRGVFVHLKYQKRVWPIAVQEDLVARILLTLLDYSGQAMTGGGDLFAETVNLTIDESRGESFYLRPGRYVKFSLMYLDTTQAVFVPLSTPHKKHENEESGTDLNGVCTIARRHGGIITLDRKGNIGTTFNLYLPASEHEVGGNIGTPDNTLMVAPAPDHS